MILNCICRIFLFISSGNCICKFVLCVRRALLLLHQMSGSVMIGMEWNRCRSKKQFTIDLRELSQFLRSKLYVKGLGSPKDADTIGENWTRHFSKNPTIHLTHSVYFDTNRQQRAVAALDLFPHTITRVVHTLHNKATRTQIITSYSHSRTDMRVHR